MPRVENWRTRFERQWKRFEQAKATAQERGYILPKEVTEIQKAKGGYKQAFGRIKQYTLTKIQRLSTYSTPEGEVPGGRVMAQARQRSKNIYSNLGEYYTIQKAKARVAKIDTEFDDIVIPRSVSHTSISQALEEAYSSFKQKYEDKVTQYDNSKELEDLYVDLYRKQFGGVPQIVPSFDRNDDEQSVVDYLEHQKNVVKELEEQYKELFEGTYGAPPRTIPTMFPSYTINTLYNMMRSADATYQKEAEEDIAKLQGKVMSAQDVKDNTLLEVQHTISSFNNRLLRYKVQDKLTQAFKDDREGTMKRLTEGISEMNEKLQQAATYQYEGDFENNADSQSSQFYNWWTDFITGSFSSEDQLDYAESEYE